MSMCRTTYLLYGFKFEKREDIKNISNHYEELMEKKPLSEIFNHIKSDQVLVYDSLYEEYVFVGLDLASVNEDRDEMDVIISEDKLLNLKSKLEEYMKSWPDYLIDMTKNYKSKLYLFVHAY